MKKTIAFFGTFPPLEKGSRASSETLAMAISKAGYAVSLVSRSSVVLFRMLESVRAALTVRADMAVLDVFSSRVHLLTNVVSRILARRRIPIISVLRGGALIEKYTDIASTLEPILQRSSQIVSPSNFLRVGFEERGYSVETVPNVLNLDRFPYIERNRANDEIRLLWVRAFADIYRPHWPVEIVWHLQKQGISSHLSMVGPDKGFLGSARALAEELDVAASIDFVGPVPNDELFEYYHSHDYLLNTTMFESFGVALAESAATGLPIVSAAVGEVEHSWTDDEDIFMVPGNSSVEFADRIAELYEVDRDGARYRHVSRTAREKIGGFSMENVLPRWERILESVCDDRVQ